MANAALLAAVRELNHGLTALSPWDVHIYPHQQVLSDVKAMNAALTALRLAEPDKQAALDALGGTYLTWYGVNFSYPVFLWELTRRAPGYYRITWGGQGQLPYPVDVMPEYRAIEAGGYLGAATALTIKRDFYLGDLTMRVEQMTSVLESVTAQIDALK